MPPAKFRANLHSINLQSSNTASRGIRCLYVQQISEKFAREYQFNLRKLQNANTKIDVIGKVHPRQSSHRSPAVQTSRIGCCRKQACQSFLLSTILLGLPWTMNEDDALSPTQARHAIPPAIHATGAVI